MSQIKAARSQRGIAQLFFRGDTAVRPSGGRGGSRSPQTGHSPSTSPTGLLLNKANVTEEAALSQLREAYRGTGFEVRSATRCMCSRLHDAVIRVYDDAGNVIETQEHAHALRVALAVVSPGLVTALCRCRAGKFPGHRRAAVSR